MKLTEAARHLFFLLAAIALVLLVGPVWGSGDCKGQSCNQDSGGSNASSDSMSGAVSDAVSTTGSSRSLALGNGLGDVDIAGCLGSEQFGTPLFSKQKLVINKVCLADFYLKMQKYSLAAQSLCNVPEILAEFDDEASCEAAHDFAPVAVPEAHIEQEQQFHMEQQVKYDRLEAKIEELEKRRSAPRRVVQPQPFLTEEKRSALQAILDEDDD